MYGSMRPLDARVHARVSSCSLCNAHICLRPNAFYNGLWFADLELGRVLIHLQIEHASYSLPLFLSFLFVIVSPIL